MSTAGVNFSKKIGDKDSYSRVVDFEIPLTTTTGTIGHIEDASQYGILLYEITIAGISGTIGLAMEGRIGTGPFSNMHADGEAIDYTVDGTYLMYSAVRIPVEECRLQRSGAGTGSVTVKFRGGN